jgi:hypothetical protein
MCVEVKHGPGLIQESLASQDMMHMFQNVLMRFDHENVHC